MRCFGSAETVKKTSLKMSVTEQRGVCAGGKKPTARSINRILKRFGTFQNPHSVAKILFRHAVRCFGSAFFEK